MYLKNRRTLIEWVDNIKTNGSVLFIDYTGLAAKTHIKLQLCYPAEKLLFNPDSLVGFVDGAVVIDSQHVLPDHDFDICVHIVSNGLESSTNLLSYDGPLWPSSLFAEKTETEILLEESTFPLLDELEKLLPENNEVRIYRENLKEIIAAAP